MSTSSRSLPLLRPSSRLVAHEIRVASRPLEQVGAELIATIYCERQRRTLEVDSCAYCERFARIEVHEGGFAMLCRSTDEDPDADS
jgi:hypothetical protein